MAKLSAVPITRVADEELVERLTLAVEQAKSGELASIFYLKIKADGAWTPGWAGKGQDTHKMIGILEALKWELLYREAQES